MRLAPAIACATLLAAGPSPAVAAIVRCEAADGRVTYSNAECPPDAKLVRKVEPTPPVIVHDAARPKEKSGSDRPAEKSGDDRSVAKTGDARPAAKLEPSRPRRNEDPVQFDQELSAQLAAQRRECEARLRELSRLQDDVGAVSPTERASAELSLRRAQDDYQALCPRQR